MLKYNYNTIKTIPFTTIYNHYNHFIIIYYKTFYANYNFITTLSEKSRHYAQCLTWQCPENFYKNCWPGGDSKVHQ
jgi:hypothetical protein